MTGSDSTEKDDGFFIPVALDPSPAPTPNSINNDSTKRKDYFNLPKSSFADKRNDSPSSTPHIAFQNKGRQQSSDRDLTAAQTPTSKLSQPSTSRSDQHSSPPSEDRQQRAALRSQTNTDDSKGQTPKGRKAATSSSSSSSSIHEGGVDVKANHSTSQSEVRKNGEAGLPPSRFSQDTRKPEADDRRGSGDSNPKSGSRPDTGKPVTRKDSSPPSARNSKLNLFFRISGFGSFFTDLVQLHQLRRLARSVESQETRMSLLQESPLHGLKLPTKAVPEPTMPAHGVHRLRWLGSLVQAREMNRDHLNRLQSFLDGVTAAISRWTRIWPGYSEPMSLPPTFCVGRPMSPDTAVPTVLTRTKHQLEEVTLVASAKQLGAPPRPNGPKLLFMRNEAGHHPI